MSNESRPFRATHVRGDPGPVLHRVALHSDVVDLPVRVGEHKVLPGRDGLARLRLALGVLQETVRVVGRKTRFRSELTTDSIIDH